MHFFSVHCKDCKSVSDTNECSNQTLCKTEQVSFFLSWFFLLYVQFIFVENIQVLCSFKYLKATPVAELILHCIFFLYQIKRKQFLILYSSGSCLI